MLGAFVQHDHGNDAINLYGHMWKMEIEPSPATLVSILSTCSLLGSTTRGKKIHMLVVENRSEADSILATAVVHMYGKCGQLSDAWAVFNRTKVRDPISWNAILNAYAQNGDDEMVLELFKEMLRDGVKPDKVTYISVLYACSHSGSVGNAQEYFDSMQKIYGLEPNTKHYACMIDLFGRAGLIEEAENFLRKMPIEPDTIVLTAYSGACRVHNDSIRGKWAAERLMDLDPHLESPYITLSNIYAAEGRWENVEGIRRKMEENVQNRTGRSWIEVDNFVHEFVSADCSHPQLKDIHGVLHHLGNQLKKAGYAKMEKNVFIDADTLSNNDVFCRHSEMLAIGFGFLKVPSGKSIRIFKNLPICPDCHAASGALSKLFDRNIVVRDTYRFHHFVDGSCSCGDYF
ncbi:hypothetical protein KP509_20G079900 [Ceratopteris richardii]|nr:hypothetical protein KP509_20G079900 [Ceratopteris richardii]